MTDFHKIFDLLGSQVKILSQISLQMTKSTMATIVANNLNFWTTMTSHMSCLCVSRIASATMLISAALGNYF